MFDFVDGFRLQVRAVFVLGLVMLGSIVLLGRFFDPTIQSFLLLGGGAMFMAAMHQALQHHHAARQRRLEERLHSVANASPALFWTSGPDKGCDWFNQRWLDFTGRPLERELGNGWAEGVHPDDLERFLNVYTTAFDSRQAFSIEYRLRRHDGEYRWLIDQGVPRHGADGAFLGYIGSCLDITEEKGLRERLEKSETSYRDLFEANPHPMWFFDLETLAFLEVNAAAQHHYGYSREEFLRMTIKDIRPQEDVPRLIDVVDQTRTGFSDVGVWRHRTRDGRLIDVEITSHALPFKGRNAKFVLAHDVTERRRAQEGMRASEQRYRELVECANSAILHWSQNGLITFSNEYAQTFFGWTASEITNQPVSILVPDTASSGADLKHLITDIVEHPERYLNNVNENIRRDGRRVWMIWTNRALRDENGNVTGILAIGNDITEHKRIEEDLKRRNEELEDFYRASVGRELRMIALKREVNELSRQLRLPPPYDLSDIDTPGADTP